jgi:nucleoside-diphosphate-sugar epimerase
MSAAANGRRTAFVTGGTGFLGTHLVEQLASSGWDVTALHRAGSRVAELDRLRVRRVLGDVRDVEALRRAMPEGVDAVFHVAASLTFWAPRHREQDAVNVGGTRNVVAVARERGARRLVHTSSIAAFGEHAGAVTEETPSNAERARLNYFRTKWQAEVEVRRGIDAGLDAVILNPANIVGPHDRTGWSRMFFLVEGRKLAALYPGPGRGSWCHAREVARAHVAAAQRGRCGANYLLGGADAPYAEFQRMIAALLGRAPPRRALPEPVFRALAAITVLPSYVTRREPPVTPENAYLVCRDLLCRSDRAQRELGYRPVPLREMLEDAHAWLVGEGLLPPPLEGSPRPIRSAPPPPARPPPRPGPPPRPPA